MTLLIGLISLLLFLSVYFVMYAKVFGFHYHGDGKFIDHGIATAFNRYELDLGTIDLCHKGKYEFDVADLPREDYALDILYCNETVSENNLKIMEDSIALSVIAIEVENENKTHSVKRKGYIRNDNIAIPEIYDSLDMMPSRILSTQGAQCVKWRIFSDDIGYDSEPDIVSIWNFWEFFAFNHSKKHITLEIIEPVIYQDKDVACKATIKLQGGGWK